MGQSESVYVSSSGGERIYEMFLNIVAHFLCIGIFLFNSTIQVFISLLLIVYWFVPSDLHVIAHLYPLMIILHKLSVHVCKHLFHFCRPVPSGFYYCYCLCTFYGVVYL